MANDTTTTLNAGSGGDVMDETLATQTSGTVAKRPRVVPGGDDGSLQTFESNAAQNYAHTRDRVGGDLIEQLLFEARKQTMLLVLLYENITGATLTVNEINDMGANPWV